MSSAKIVALVFAVAVLAAAGVFVPQHRQLQRAWAEHHDLAARQGQLIAERDAASNAVRTARLELQAAQADRPELIRLREEVGLLRRERDTLKARLAQPTAPVVTAKAIAKPGRYMTSGQLSFAGYGAPEAALESMTWAMLHGDYDKSLATLGPELQQAELANPKGRDEFEARRRAMVPLFKGMQILASKTLSDDTVELKVQVDLVSLDASEEMPMLLIQPMVKVGADWKLGNAERPYDEAWDQGGSSQPPAQ